MVIKLTPQEEVVFSSLSSKGLSCEELAEITGINIGSVRSVVRTLYRHGVVDRTRVTHTPGGIGSGSFHYNYTRPA